MALRATIGVTAFAVALAGSGAAQEADFFEREVRPILANRCYACHGPHAGAGQAGLRLDSLAGMLKGGRSGPAIVPGKAQGSLLIHAINHDTSLQMPPKAKLPIAEVMTLTRWVDEGARWPNAAPVARAGPEETAEADGFTDRERSHWAFQPVRDPEPPPGGGTPIDAFVRSRLESQGLRPGRRADKRTLIRRASFDLHGLPPDPDQVRAFLDDDSEDAFARLVDRLLASPRYGERWGRHWLDVARYADSNGMDDNVVHGDAWRYRDYVIQAFNEDKPYDRFVREQLAGDILTRWGEPNRASGLIATGFLMLGPKMVGEDDPVKQKLDFADEQLATTSRAFLALSVDCARCHDHKFDPIRSADYYAMLGIFASTKTVLSYRVTSKLNATALADAQADRTLSEIERRFDYHDDFVTNYNRATTPKQVVEAQKQAMNDALDDYFRVPKALAVSEGEIQDLPVMLRGSHLTPGAVAPRGFPAILAGEARAPIGTDRSGRRELAAWLTRTDHPLVARVMANRIWHWHFGAGIVRTPDNFGALGDRPSHPDLLDWLARRFIESGWSIKAMHRLIMLSSAYQTAAEPNPAAAEADPENRLLGRANRRRLEAEALRDALLAVSGRLDSTMGGKTLPQRNFANLNADAGSRDPQLYASGRRSVYLPVLRSALYEVFSAFDFADPSTANGRRGSTLVAPQALFMMNADLMEDAASGFAERLERQTGGEVTQAIRLAHEIAYARPAEAAEIADWRAFLDRYEEAANSRSAAWQAFCRVLLSANEFVYVQ